MDIRTLAIDCGIVALISSALFFGYCFLKRGNFLLGAEWLVIGFSASNMFLNFNGINQTSGTIAWTCDAFSRAVGIPVIALLGFAQLTHGYRPTLLTDIVLFVGGFLLAVTFVDSAALAPYLPYAYLVGSLAWTAYQFYLMRKLHSIGHGGLAALVGFFLVAVTGVGLLEGVYEIPGDATNTFLNFYFIAHWTWAAYFAALYFVYVALERKLGRAAH